MTKGKALNGKPYGKCGITSILVGVACMAMAADPIVWYRADMGVTTNAAGKVTAWANQGTLGSSADLANTNAAAPGVTFLASDSTMGNAPVLEFNSQDILVASSATSLGNVKLGGAWFVAFRYKGVVGGNNANNYGPFGHGTSSNRFGFYQGWDGFCLCYYGSGFSLQSNWRFDTDADIVSCATFRPTAGSYNANIQGWRRGEASVLGGWDQRDADGKFVVGVFNPELTWTKPFIGLIAEARYYGAPMTAAERFCVECEMAARYAIPLGSTGAFSFSAELLSGCTNAPAAFGSANKWGKAAEMAMSATSGALTVAFAETPSADTNLVYVAHDGAAGQARMWCLAGMDNAQATPLVLTFAGAEYVSDPDLALYRSNGEDWTKVSAVKTVSAEELSFALPAGWVSGRYRVCTPDAIVASSVAVWYRADKGVTADIDGKVTGWTNSGFLGSDFDLAVAAEKPTLVADGIGSRPSIRFTSTNTYLRTAGEVDTGINAVHGGAYFVVCRFDSTKPQGAMCPFGIWSPAGSTSTSTQRFGIHSASGSSTVCLNFFAQCHSFYELTRTMNSQMIGLSSYRPAGYDVNKLRMTQNGALKVGNRIPAPYVGVLSVGEFNVTAFKSGYDGDVAEVRLYNRPLTARESAAVELDISARYGIDMATCGSYDAAGLAEHDTDRTVIGIAKDRGADEENPPLTWSDGALSFAFKVAPTSSDTNALAVVAHDGEQTTFVPWTSPDVTTLERTWFISSAMPELGGVLEFSLDMTGSAKKKFLLYRKAPGDTEFRMCPVEGVKTETSVVFTFDELPAGVYRLVCKMTYSGFSILFK